MKKLCGLLVILFMIGACESSRPVLHTLFYRPEKVQEASPDKVRECRYIGDIYLDGHWDSKEASRKAKKGAARMGGTHLVWMQPYSNARVYQCKEAVIDD